MGKLDVDNIEIWVWPNEGGYEPHFHFWNADRTIDGCIKLETNDYFPHGKYTSTLNSKQRKMLVKFLSSPSKNFPGLANWNVVIGMWNSSNPQKQVDLDAPMPDYGVAQLVEQLICNQQVPSVQVRPEAPEMSASLLTSGFCCTM